MASANDLTNILSGSHLPSSPPDSDAIKLLQFLDTAALSIKMTLKKSMKPKRKRLLKDSYDTYCRKRFDKSDSKVSDDKSSDRKDGPLVSQENAQKSINSLFDIEPLKAFNGLYNGNTSTYNSMRPNLDKSLASRDLPLSFFVEPALREKSHSVAALNKRTRFENSSKNSSKTCNSGAKDNFLHSTSEGSPVSLDSYDDSCPKSPSLPEDTLESILDQGEINYLLGSHGWSQEMDADKGQHFLISDSRGNSTRSCAMSIDLSSSAPPSPRSFSESSHDSWFSQTSAPPVTCDWTESQGLTIQAWSQSLSQTCTYSDNDCVLFKSQTNPIQKSKYQPDNSDSVKVYHKYPGYKPDNPTDDCHSHTGNPASYFHWTGAQSQAHQTCCPSQTWHRGLNAETTQYKNTMLFNDQWSHQYYPHLSWSSNAHT
ncbi:hypothetical protein Bpfe_010980 [Biomphalaria pfeifferi]|uniref:Uncharacterized protein n=1 Tax=Biomphalaria pfeifferi TaxID=112525 RepID=A0AAD8BRI1_BIOPF|nr:hypothetical protein Bpfe_010980 [Biomphalaria pfeifferi]